MNAYSEDLRKKIVQALRRGTGKSEAARSFGVSLSSVKRYARMAEEGRPLAPKKRPGSRPKMDEKVPEGSWSRTWRSAPQPRCPSDASTCGRWRG
jgi:transposase